MVSASESTGALPTTDAIWKLLNEADDEKSKWYAAQWGQWFVRLVDAVSALDNGLTRRAEYDSGLEACAICHKATQNGVWGCDKCWDDIKVMAAEFLRLRHGAERPPATNAVDPSAQLSGTPTPRDA